MLVDACYSGPPFSTDDSEKGFRDALIVEAFIQLVQSGPSHRNARIVLITNDGLLRTAVENRLGTSATISIRPDAVELQNLINILGSEMSEDFAARYREPAGQLFFVPKEESALYFKWEISDWIRSTLADVVNRLPDGATSRRIVQWLFPALRLLLNQVSE